MNQWHVAPLRPPHLAALIAWEGSSDYYRELARHGGILCDFLFSWYPRQCVKLQHGMGERGPRSQVTGEPVSGPETLPEDELAKNRADVPGDALRRRVMDDYYRARTWAFDKIDVPLLSAANWGGMGLHTRGNFEGFGRAGTTQKWLEVHGDTHFSHYYTNYGVGLQKRFFGRFLKGEDTWNEPPVLLNIRRPGEKFTLRARERVAARAHAMDQVLSAAGSHARRRAAADRDEALTYPTTGEGLTFFTPPMSEEVEITGPVAAKLFVSSDTTDADLFLVLRLFDPAGKEVTFIGSNDPRSPIGLGWLRASHRKLDPAQSLPHRPWHTHDEEWPLKPGEPVEARHGDLADLHRGAARPSLALTVRGNDCEYDGTDAAVPYAAYPMKGVGPFTHTHPQDRPPEIFGGTNTLHFGAQPGAVPAAADHSGEVERTPSAVRARASGRATVGARASVLRSLAVAALCPAQTPGLLDPLSRMMTIERQCFASSRNVKMPAASAGIISQWFERSVNDDDARARRRSSD